LINLEFVNHIGRGYCRLTDGSIVTQPRHVPNINCDGVLVDLPTSVPTSNEQSSNIGSFICEITEFFLNGVLVPGYLNYKVKLCFDPVNIHMLVILLLKQV
jgi:hypothetical protein